MSENAGSGAVRPRDAASLVLVRTDPATGNRSVLMGRRLKRASFIPDMFVFPGGRVDAEDARIMPARALSDETLARLHLAGQASRARALANAAIRETFEETGLMIGVAQTLSTSGRHHGWQEFAKSGHAPDHAPLRFLGRAITPPESPKRFHARFFVADGACASGALAGSGELIELDWYPIEAALRLPIIDVTEFMLRRVADEIHAKHAPLFSYRRGKPLNRPAKRKSGP